MPGYKISELASLEHPTSGSLFLVSDVSNSPLISKKITLQTIANNVQELLLYNGPSQICRLEGDSQLPWTAYDIPWLTDQLGLSGKADKSHRHNLTDINGFAGLMSQLDDIQTVVDQNEINTSNNTNSIITLSGDVATNAININALNIGGSTLASNINTLSGDVATNASNINTLSGDVATNAININALNIGGSTLASNINTLSGDVATNASNINTLSASKSDITHTHLLSAITNAGDAGLYNVGVSANNVVQLDGSAKLPAVDGSQLLNVPVEQAIIDYSRGTDNTHLGAYPDQPYRSIDNDLTAFVRVRDGVLQVVGSKTTTTISVGIVPYDDPEEPDIEFILPTGLRLSSFSGDSDQKGTNNLPIYQQYRVDLGSNPAPVLIDGGTF